MRASSDGPLVGVHSALAVVAHPDDESFGLGAVLDHLVRGGTEVSVLCFTHGEASTLHGRDGDLAVVRAAELDAAAGILGITRTRLLRYRDARLAEVAVPVLAAEVTAFAAVARPTHLVTFDVAGVTGHPDHIRATGAALAAAGELDLPVIGWGVAATVADALNTAFGTSFAGWSDSQIDWTVRVDRTRQWAAIAAHSSQSTDNPVLRRRLRLCGDVEHLRALQ